MSRVRTSAPLRAIVARPTELSETLECGHTINRPLGLGECAMYPSKVKRRRCYLCAENVDIDKTVVTP